jgi:16S rRNA G527 N7-methylase RsmG
MDNGIKQSLLEKDIRVYGGGISGNIESLIALLEIIHDQNKINNMHAVKLGMNIVQKRIAEILQNIEHLNDTKEEVSRLYDNEGK